MTIRMRRALAVGLVAALATVGLPSPKAIAASCGALRAELASAGKERVDRRKAERYASALRRQQRELATTKRMASRGGCARSRTSQCRTITNTIAAMEKRVGELDRQRRRALKGGGGRSRSAIERDLRRKNCNGSARRTEPPKREARPTKRAASPSVSTPVAPSGPPPGNYRTVCVRTCDGYYFPISHATSRAGFADDTKQCASMCPRAETRLFVHALNGGVETMFDRTGRRYAEQSYAFRHTRPDYRPSEACSCGRPLAPVRTGTLRGTSDRPVPAPLGMAPPAGDAETRRNAAVDFGWDRAAIIARSGGAPARERPVRVVGPAFLPDPVAAEAR